MIGLQQLEAVYEILLGGLGVGVIQFRDQKNLISNGRQGRPQRSSDM